MSKANETKTQCKRGHPFDEANTYRHAGGRACKACRSERARTPKAVLAQRRLDRRQARMDAAVAAARTQEDRKLHRLEVQQQAAYKRAADALLEAKRIAALLAPPPRLCKQGHPLDPTYRGCRECSKRFLRSVRKFTSKNLGLQSRDHGRLESTKPTKVGRRKPARTLSS